MVWLVLLVVVAPLVELYVIIQVAQVVGGWETIALLVVESAVGAWLLKRQGLATVSRISEALNQGRRPDRDLVDGLLILVAGALMLAPGFVTDVFGYLLLVPFTRAPVRYLLLRRFESKGGGPLLAAAGRGRFVGTFTAGPTYEATGHDGGQDRPGPPGELRP